MTHFELITQIVNLNIKLINIGISISITSSAVGLTIRAMTEGIKKYKSRIKKKKRNDDETVLLVKTKLNTLEALVSRGLINSYISHHKFALVNKVLREYDDMKKAIKNLKTSTVHQGN